MECDNTRGGCGTVFKITTAGALTTLYTFCSLANCADGANPLAGLIQATNGDLYGTTGGGSIENGTIFQMTPAGALTTLYTFCQTACTGGGSRPYGALVQSINGDLYGTTELGGNLDGGTIFQITPSGAFTTLRSFCSLANCADGEYPYSGLIQATNGDLYGSTDFGGTRGGGTVFEFTPVGVFTTLYNFCATCDGGRGPAGLFQATNGEVYGSTTNGGTSNSGTIFSLALGLPPFVESLPTAATVGSPVEILGTDLTGATSVAFHDTTATFKVTSPTLILAEVPRGATSGKIQIVTPGGTLSSNVPFRVLPESSW
jgi:uncharacterized repeat protein (TIGR03803 family)